MIARLFISKSIVARSVNDPVLSNMPAVECVSPFGRSFIARLFRSSVYARSQFPGSLCDSNGAPDIYSISRQLPHRREIARLNASPPTLWVQHTLFRSNEKMPVERQSAVDKRIGSRLPTFVPMHNLNVCRVADKYWAFSIASRTLLDNSKTTWHNSIVLSRARHQTVGSHYSVRCGRQAAAERQLKNSHITMCCTGAAGRAAIALEHRSPRPGEHGRYPHDSNHYLFRCGIVVGYRRLWVAGWTFAILPSKRS